MWVWFAVYFHSRPFVHSDADMSCMDVLVRGDEMVAHNGSKELRGSHWMLLGEYIDCLLLRVCCYDCRIVGLCVSRHGENVVYG